MTFNIAKQISWDLVVHQMLPQPSPPPPLSSADYGEALPPRHMMMSSNGNFFRVTGPLCGEFTGPGEFPTQRPVTRSFDVFFDLRLNKRLSKQPWGWWFETTSWSLWRQWKSMMDGPKWPVEERHTSHRIDGVSFLTVRTIRNGHFADVALQSISLLKPLHFYLNYI